MDLERGEWYGLIPPLQMTSLEVTSVMGCEYNQHRSGIRTVPMLDTYAIVVWYTDTVVVPKSDTVHPELLEDGVRGRGADEEYDRQELGREMHILQPFCGESEWRVAENWGPKSASALRLYTYPALLVLLGAWHSAG